MTHMSLEKNIRESDLQKMNMNNKLMIKVENLRFNSMNKIDGII